MMSASRDLWRIIIKSDGLEDSPEREVRNLEFKCVTPPLVSSVIQDKSQGLLSLSSCISEIGMIRIASSLIASHRVTEKIKWSSSILQSFEKWKMLRSYKNGASLVAQWLRICLPMQGTRVRALVWEDPTCRGATRSVSHNYWTCASGACAPQQERPRQWEARAPWWRVAPARRN